MRLPLPKTVMAFERTYSSERACRDALFRARWPDGFRCADCGSDRVWRLRCRAAVECVSCGRQQSLTAGTLFHGTKLPLRVVFRILYMIVAEKSGTNAMAISRQTGVSYPTSLLWMRRVRAAMEARPHGKLHGTVEVDETTIGGRVPGTRGRQKSSNRHLVVVLAEDRGEDGIGRIRLEHVDCASQEVLCAVVEANVEPGSGIRTDDWSGYNPLERKGYWHDPRNIRQSGKKAHEELPLVHLVASLVKRYIRGTFHGSLSRGWLSSMLREFEFRFNRRRSRYRPHLFNRLLEAGLGQRPPTRAMLADIARLATCVSL